MKNKLIMVEIPYENHYSYKGDVILSDSDFQIGKLYEMIGSAIFENVELFVVRIKEFPLNEFGELPSYVQSIHDGYIFMDIKNLNRFFKPLREYNLDNLV